MLKSQDLPGFIMLPPPPVLMVDMAHAAAPLIARMTMEADDVILFRTRLNALDQKISGNMLIFSEAAMLRKIASRLRELVAG
jgi:hypothetical protein